MNRAQYASHDPLWSERKLVDLRTSRLTIPEKGDGKIVAMAFDGERMQVVPTVVPHQNGFGATSGYARIRQARESGDPFVLCLVESYNVAFLGRK